MFVGFELYVSVNFKKTVKKNKNKNTSLEIFDDTTRQIGKRILYYTTSIT